MKSVAEKVIDLLRDQPHLAERNDKQLIATYLQVYHNHQIPKPVLDAMPSFETIRRIRQKYTEASR